VFGLTARIIRNHAALDAPENRGVAGSIPALAISLWAAGKRSISEEIAQR
jgi:hypothetical protein